MPPGVLPCDNRQTPGDTLGAPANSGMVTALSQDSPVCKFAVTGYA